MRVAIHYSDGHYSLYDPTKHSFAADVDPEAWMKANTIEIPESDWRLYQEHVAQERWWYQRIQAYENMILNKGKED